MEKQRTIKNPVELSGVGLNTGNSVNLRFKPSPPNSGINFVRIDLKDRPIINSELANVIDMSKSPHHTSLGAGGVDIQTVEHLMSALAGLSIDNIFIELDSNEVPNFDGSSTKFVEVLKQAGIVEQDTPKRYFVIREPIWCSEEDASIVALPSLDFRISYTLDYENSPIRPQHLELIITPDIFEREIASSRTFCLERDVERLLKMGLGKGGNYDNTLVVGENGVINNRLRFEDEFARHKILDLIGDLFILGFSIKAHIIAVKSGHRLNIKLMQKIKSRRDKLLEGGLAPALDIAPTQGEIDINVIKRILPHRYPFLLVDKILSMDDKRIVSIKNVTANEEFFLGHFPGRPIMPGVLIVEAMAQTAGVLMLSKDENYGKLAYFTGIDGVRFRKTVVPGEQLVLEVEIIKFRSKTGQVRAEAKVDGKLVCEAELMFALVEA